MKKMDIIIIVSVLLIETLLMFFMLNRFDNNVGEDRYVEIYVGNQLIFSEKLTEDLEKKYLVLSKDDVIFDIISVDLDYEITDELKGYDLVHIHNNGVQVIAADCRDRVIVKMGFTKHSYYPLICLPRNMVIRIQEVDTDYIVLI